MGPAKPDLQPLGKYGSVPGSKELVRLPLLKNGQPEVIATIPELTLSKIANEAFERPLTKYEQITASSVMTVRNAGVLDDGTPWLHVGTVMAGDDDYDFLFRLVDGDWVFEEFVHCSRFAACGFATFGKNEPYSGKSEIAPQLWDGSVTDNPYHVRDELVSTLEGGYRELVRNDRFFFR